MKFSKYMLGFFLVVTFLFGATSVQAKETKNNKASKPEEKVLWKSLNKEQKKEWKNWAKKNCLNIETKKICDESGKEAFEFVIQNRKLAAENLNTTSIPTPVVWQVDALSTRDAGPFTTGTGYVGFRVEKDLKDKTMWFISATKPVDDSTLPAGKFQFLTALSLGALSPRDITQNIATDYRRTLGSFAGPGEEGKWPTEKYVWFRIQQYHDGQLGPAQILKGRIQVEL